MANLAEFLVETVRRQPERPALRLGSRSSRTRSWTNAAPAPPPCSHPKAYDRETGWR